MFSFGDVVWRVLRAPVFDGVRPFLIRSDGYLLVGRTGWCESFSVFVLGSKLSVEYFSKLFFVSDPSVKFFGRVALSRVVSFAEKLGVDLTVVESNWFFSRFLGDNGFFVSPRLDFLWKLLILTKLYLISSEGKRRRLRQVAVAGYTYEVIRDQDKLDVFYNELYLPHMLKRHAGCALPISLSECRELFSKGELLLIKSGNDLVSGNLLVPHNCELHSPVVGVSDIEEHLTLGSYAAYYFSILVGIERGFVRMDFGEAPPFMSDGLFQFKKGLGMWVRAARGDSAQVFGVRFSGLGESVRRFLSVNSFVFVDGEGLSGVVFLDRVDELSVKPFCVPGLTRLYIISNSLNFSNSNDDTIEKVILEKNLGKVSALSVLSMYCFEENLSLFVLNLVDFVPPH